MAKILIIDDDRDLVDITRIILEKEGYEVISASNPDDGWDAAQTEKPDAILLDVMMDAEDDGFVLAQKLRKEGFKTPIIMLTNVARVTGLDFGIDDEMVPVDEYAEKPLSPKNLLALVRKHVKN
jgi:DNA-binding response OmpR family regulator